jgi:hypothetical protein
MIKKIIFLCLAMLSVTCFADPIKNYVDSLQEQARLVKWVTQTTNGKMSDAKALSIIRDVYAHSYSKNLNPRTVLAIIRVESTFQENAKSSYGAKGIMQVVPRFHKTKLAGRNPFNSSVSTEVGTSILEDCGKKSKGKLYSMLQCYSGGGGAKYYKKVLAYQTELSRSIVPKETMYAFN